MANRPLPASDPADPLTADACYAARQLLEWSTAKLAAEAGTSSHAVQKLEQGGSVRLDTLRAIRLALEKAGIALAGENGGGPCVRLRQPSE